MKRKCDEPLSNVAFNVNVRRYTLGYGDAEPGITNVIDPFPGGLIDDAPIKFLPLGGLGEIGMNCALVGTDNRYVLLDAGLMFPDHEELGIQKVLPDVSFLARG